MTHGDRTERVIELLTAVALLAVGCAGIDPKVRNEKIDSRVAELERCEG